MNTIQNKLASLKLATRWCGSCRQLLLAGAVFLLAGSGAYAADGSFAAPFPIGGAWGTYTADNSNSFPAVGTPNIAGNPPVAPVWFQFTATNDGDVTSLFRAS